MSQMPSLLDLDIDYNPSVAIDSSDADAVPDAVTATSADGRTVHAVTPDECWRQLRAFSQRRTIVIDVSRTLIDLVRSCRRSGFEFHPPDNPTARSLDYK